MGVLRIILGYLSIALVAGLASGCAWGPPPAVEPINDTPKQLRDRQVIVTLGPATRARWANVTEDLSSDYDLTKVGAFVLNALGVQCIVFEIPGERSVPNVIAELDADHRVESVQANQVFAGLLQANHSDTYSHLQYGASLVGARSVHPYRTGKGVTVAIIDTGADRAHPDLIGQIANTANFVEGGEATFGHDLHGTAVAGVIGARADNAVGIFGIAPGADILAVKACWYPQSAASHALCSSWTLAKAVDFIIAKKAHLLNMSLAGPPDPLLARLLAKARQRGITVVAAVADSGKFQPGFPASMDTVIAAVATDADGKVEPIEWSSSMNTLAAPGREIVTTVPGGSYDFLSGSSLAAAHVTGVIALLLEQAPSLSPGDIGALLRSTARITPSRPMGLIDACAALTKLTGKPVCI